MSFKRSAVFVFILLFLLGGCSSKPEKERLSVTTKANFSLLPERPQFIMYFNFMNMRSSGFWKEFISDSVINAEKTLGSMLSLFREATGASISEGLDEIYFANTWTGENAIVLKGIFDRNRLAEFTKTDSLFTRRNYPEGITVYNHLPTGLFFFMKDNFTLCGSNYTKQIDQMREVTDTTKAGLLLNDTLLSAIEDVSYKENFWLVTTEKTFIRGIFSNFAMVKSDGAGAEEKMNLDSLMSGNTPDSVTKADDILINKLHEKINSFSISGRMKDNLDVLIQFECTDDESAETVSGLFKGLISLTQLSSALRKDKTPAPVEQILNEITVDTYENSVMMKMKVTAENIGKFRKSSLTGGTNR